MSELIKAVKQYIEQGYSCIPVDRLKQPIIKTWGKYQIEPMSVDDVDKHFKNAFGVAMLMGGKHSLVCIDFDLKYSLVNDLYEQIKVKVPLDILKKMHVRKTNGVGFHWVFSCPERKGANQQLAQRHTSAEEKHETYMELFNNPVTRQTALKTASNDKVRVLIETREFGGYIVCPPTPNYELIYGQQVNEISGDEYDTLMEIMRSFNEYKKLSQNRKIDRYKDNDINPFAEYDKRGDVIKLLEDYGWTIEDERKNAVRLRRPGAVSASSALFDTATRVLTVFSTSTVFEANKGFPPASVYTLLECEDDTNLAYQKLLDLGYGESLN